MKLFVHSVFLYNLINYIILKDNKQNIPEIRFPGFEGEWIKVPAKDIFKSYSNKKHNGNLPVLAVTQDQGVVPRDTLDLKINTSQKSVKSYKIIEKGDFVISLRSFQGGIEYSYIKGICSPAYTILKPKVEIDDIFYKHYLKKDSFISRLNYAVRGIRDGKQISYSDFSEIIIPYTSVDEQEKIGKFLDCLDKKIELMEIKRKKMISLKLYFLQKLFCNKQNIPELRFPEFKDDWEEISIKDKFDFFSTNSFSRAKLNEEDGKIMNIHYGDIHTKFPSIVNVKKEEIPFITEEIEDKKINKFEKCENGDLLIADASEDYADIGKTIEIQGITDEQIVGGLHTLLLRDKTANVTPMFNGYLFQNEKLKKQIKIKANGISVLGISKKELQKISVNIPSKEEQLCISNLLYSVDKKISFMEKEKELNIEFKKSLLTKMFC